VRKRWWVVGGTVLALLGVSAAGLGAHADWLRGRWDAAHAAADLASRLSGIDGVRSATAAYDPIGLPDAGLEVRVQFAEHARSASWGRSSALIRSAASSAALRTVITTASFTERGSASSVRVEPLLFSEAQIDAEIAAWHSLQHDVGDAVSLRLGRDSQYTDGSGPATREYVVRSAAAMRTVARRWPTTPPTLDPSIPTQWRSPGLQFSSMPTSAVMAAVSRLADAMPLAPATTTATRHATGTYGVVLGNLRGFGVAILSLRDGKPASSSDASVPELVTGVRTALDAGAAEVDWSHAGAYSSIVVGECGTYTVAGRTVITHLSTTAANDRFAATLAAAGYDLPPGVRSGVCA
jgi:hypothetical protein